MTKINSDEDEKVEIPFLNQKKLITKVSLQKNFYHIWLNSEIESADKYTDVFDCLMQASEGDVIAFHINTPGGDLDTALQLIDAIESTPATTIAFLEGQVLSAGSMIVMACDNIEISKYAYMMIHTFSQVIGGKASDIRTTTDFHNKWWANIFESIYKDFCTPAEIKEILSGRELWLDADACLERFNNRKKIREERDVKEITKKQIQINKIVDLMQKNDVNLGEIAAAIKFKV